MKLHSKADLFQRFSHQKVVIGALRFYKVGNQADLGQVSGCGNRNGHYVPDGLVEAWETEMHLIFSKELERTNWYESCGLTGIGSFAEGCRQVFVLFIVLNMALLVMNRDEIVHVDLGAHFDAEILLVGKVPGGSVADDGSIFAGIGFHNHRFFSITGGHCE